MKRWVCKWVFIGILGIFAIFPKVVLGSEFQTISFDSSRVGHDSWFGQDKAKHFLASMLLTGSAMYLVHSKWDIPRDQSQIWGISFAFSLGLVKEFYDKRKPLGRFSWKDLSFDILGIGVGFLCFARW